MLNLTKETAMLNLTKAAPTMKRVRGVLNWDMHPIYKDSRSEGFDLDIFAFVTYQGKLKNPGSDVAYFNNKSVYEGAVVIPRDNRNGEGDEDEEVLLELGKLPTTCDGVELFVFIHEADKRQQNFSMISGGSFSVADADSGKEVQKYVLAQFATGTALHVGSFTRKDGDWCFQPVGDAAIADPNQVLTAFM